MTSSLSTYQARQKLSALSGCKVYHSRQNEDKELLTTDPCHAVDQPGSPCGPFETCFERIMSASMDDLSKEKEKEK